MDVQLHNHPATFWFSIVQVVPRAANCALSPRTRAVWARSCSWVG